MTVDTQRLERFYEVMVRIRRFDSPTTSYTPDGEREGIAQAQ
jgi:hypothetical protein